VTASPTQVQAPGGVVTFTVRIGLTGDGSASISFIGDSVVGELTQPNNVHVVTNGCKGSIDHLVTAASPFTCPFSVQVGGAAGDVVTRTVSAKATVQSVTAAAGGVSTMSIGDTIGDDATVNVAVVAPGGTTGGTAGGDTSGGTTGGGTTGGTTGGGSTGSTTGGGTTGGTTGGAATAATTATTVATRLPVMGANTDRLLMLALALLGFGLVMAGQGVIADGRRRA